jgi:hypothetical protein
MIQSFDKLLRKYKLNVTWWQQDLISWKWSNVVLFQRWKKREYTLCLPCTPIMAPWISYRYPKCNAVSWFPQPCLESLIRFSEFRWTELATEIEEIESYSAAKQAFRILFYLVVKRPQLVLFRIITSENHLHKRSNTNFLQLYRYVSYAFTLYLYIAYFHRGLQNRIRR